MKNEIKIITNESCTWSILNYNDEFERQGECVTHLDLLDLLEHLGYEVKSYEITDKDMDSISYKNM